jgi:hypothetical protein
LDVALAAALTKAAELGDVTLMAAIVAEIKTRREVRVSVDSLNG